MDPKPEYKPVPVIAAVHIAHHCDKDIVVIFSIDHAHELQHVTSFGKSPADKIVAAKFGDAIEKIVGEVSLRTTFEDFRTLDAAKFKFERDKLTGFVEDLLLHATPGSVCACCTLRERQEAIEAARRFVGDLKRAEK